MKGDIVELFCWQCDDYTDQVILFINDCDTASECSQCYAENWEGN
jgi:hypothetical protein